MGNKKNVVFAPRETQLSKKWADTHPEIPVNNQQHSFDTEERKETFISKQYRTHDDRARYDWYRDEWYRRAKEYDAGDMPLSVGVELVSTCNLNCSMCYTITDEFQTAVVGSQRMIPWAIVKAIIDEAAELNVPSILFSWRGESTLYRQKHNDETYTIVDAFQYAKDRGILETSTLTNGQLLTEEMAIGLIEAKANWINISIDGLGQTYNKVRTPKKHLNRKKFDAFDLVVSNIRRLVELREKMNQSTPRIRTNTIYPTIADDPEGYHAFMKSIGVDWVTVNEILDFRGAGVDGEQLPEDAILDNWACQYPFQRLMIAANGVILPCTGAHNEEDGLSLGQYVGSKPKRTRRAGSNFVIHELPQITLSEAWHSKKLSKIRDLHKRGLRKLITDGCRNCRHGAVKNGVTWVPEDWDFETMEWRDHKFRT